MSESEGGRVFFSSRGRSLDVEDEIVLTSVGVDIGSSTSHLVFSQIKLERLDSRYVVTERKTLYQSEILLTPYLDDEAIDEAALSAFVAAQYERAGLTPAAVDTGALVLTGVAVRRRNARAIADVFAREAGKLVAVSAGDSLETIMAAYGSGAAARSIRERAPVVNIDIGGGTSKIAICADGRVTDRTAIDIGARIVAFDSERRVVRLEEAGRWFASRAGLTLKLGDVLPEKAARAMAKDMASMLIAAVTGRAAEMGATSLLRLEQLKPHQARAATISGGVAEFVYGDGTQNFGDLGPQLARAFRMQLEAEGFELKVPDEKIRATVIGAAQYTAQVSGSTIFVSPLDILPLRNVPVVAPQFGLDTPEIDAARIESALRDALRYMELDAAEGAIGVFVPWRGSASFDRLDTFCRGLLAGIGPNASARTIVLVGDNDVGGLVGIHLRHELHYDGPLVSIDGLELKAFDYVDIGDMLEASGAVPVVIKSLLFPADSRLGKPIAA